MLRHHIEGGAVIAPSTCYPVREVEMEVVFGTPSKNCAGAGVCLIANRSAYWQTIACPHAPVIIHYLPEGQLVFRFRKRHLRSEAFSPFFQGEEFQVDEAFLLPQRLQRLWNLETDRIPAGRYPLEEYSREWRLYFPI